MVQDAIEAILKQKLGLDANSIGSRSIARAVEQRQTACQVSERAAYLALLKTSSQELNNLIEAVVVAETWFFRDKEPFVYLRHYIRERRSNSAQMRVLSVPCSTGEEPYSIAMTLLDSGLTTRQFQIDAVDISQNALTKAKQAIYGRKSFRGVEEPVIQRYFEKVAGGYEVKSIVRESVNFIHGNVLEPRFLAPEKYQIIFCRNLLIYLDRAARDRVMHSLDQALVPGGILFLGAAETSQLSGKPYTPIDHAFAFAYRKEPPAPIQSRQIAIVPAKIAKSSPSAKRVIDSLPSVGLLDSAKQLADRGHLAQAAQLCESYLRTNPTQAQAHLLLGEIYQGLNQSRQAEQQFQKAIYLDPNDYEALIHLALLKEQQSDRSSAERLRQRVQRLVDSRNHLK